MGISRRSWVNNTASVVAMLAPFAAAADSEQASAHANLWGVQYRIYDAIPDDGIDPAVSWYGDIHYRLLLTSDVGDNTTYDFDEEVLYYPKFLDAFAASNSVGVVAPSGNATGKNDLAYVLDATSSVSADGHSAYGYAGLSTTATGQIEPGFYSMILGPGTGIELKGYAQVRAALGTGSKCLDEGCTFASASASLYTTFGPPDPTNPWLPLERQTGYEQMSAYATADSWCTDATCVLDQQSGLISLTYENLSAGDEIGRMRWDVSAYTSAAIAVPEPGTYALMAAGIALGVLRGRRRRA